MLVRALEVTAPTGWPRACRGLATAWARGGQGLRPAAPAPGLARALAGDHRVLVLDRPPARDPVSEASSRRPCPGSCRPHSWVGHRLSPSAGRPDPGDAGGRLWRGRHGSSWPRRGSTPAWCGSGVRAEEAPPAVVSQGGVHQLQPSASRADSLPAGDCPGGQMPEGRGRVRVEGISVALGFGLLAPGTRQVAFAGQMPAREAGCSRAPAGGIHPGRLSAPEGRMTRAGEIQGGRNSVGIGLWSSPPRQPPGALPGRMPGPRGWLASRAPAGRDSLPAAGPPGRMPRGAGNSAAISPARRPPPPGPPGAGASPAPA